MSLLLFSQEIFPLAAWEPSELVPLQLNLSWAPIWRVLFDMQEESPFILYTTKLSMYQTEIFSLTFILIVRKHPFFIIE